MWNSLYGRVSGYGDGCLYIQAGALEWSLRVSERTLSDLSVHETEIKVYLHLLHKQDELGLFGFATPDERRLFLQLLKVSGVGAKQALRILSTLSPDELVKILDAGDTNALKRIPGLGTTTAGKIILSLRGKVAVDTPRTGLKEELIDSLIKMGFDRRQVEGVVASVAAEMAGATEEDQFRAALARLNK